MHVAMDSHLTHGESEIQRTSSDPRGMFERGTPTDNGFFSLDTNELEHNNG